MTTPTAPGPAPARTGSGSGIRRRRDWDSGRAWKTLWVTTFALTLAFITWFLASAIAPKLNSIGFDLSEGQLYWLIAMPGSPAARCA